MEEVMGATAPLRCGHHFHQGLGDLKESFSFCRKILNISGLCFKSCPLPVPAGALGKQSSGERLLGA